VTQQKEDLDDDNLKKMKEKDRNTTSKFLSLVLRHSPETIDIALDVNGWADVKELIAKCAVKGHSFSFR
jgi:putative RNA 2'-phosphotransferase